LKSPAHKPGWFCNVLLQTKDLLGSFRNFAMKQAVPFICAAFPFRCSVSVAGSEGSGWRTSMLRMADELFWRIGGEGGDFAI
jgi:hypothetical protein